MALIDRAVGIVVAMDVATMAVLSRIPALPVMNGRRKNKMTPVMFCTVGRNTPSRVPRPPALRSVTASILRAM